MIENKKWKELNFIKVSGAAVIKSRKSLVLVRWARLALIRKYFLRGGKFRNFERKEEITFIKLKSTQYPL